MNTEVTAGTLANGRRDDETLDHLTRHLARTTIVFTYPLSRTSLQVTKNLLGGAMVDAVVEVDDLLHARFGGVFLACYSIGALVELLLVLRTLTIGALLLNGDSRIDQILLLFRLVSLQLGDDLVQPARPSLG